MRSEYEKIPFNQIERLLHLRPGDLHRVVPLFFYHFLIISSLVVGQVVRDTLFLSRYKAVHLPYVDMTIAVLVLLIATVYIYSGRYASLRTLQVGSIFGFAVLAGVFWWCTFILQYIWLYPALYIYVGIFGVLASAQMWILIIYLLSVRDKRLLGIVASGGIAGGTAGFLSRAVVQRFEAEHLMLLMMILLMTCAFLVMNIWRQWRPKLTEMDGSEGAEKVGKGWNLRDGIRLVRASKHLQTIAALVCLSSVVTNMAGWQFKAIAAQSFLEKNDLAGFFGSFYGFVSILGFLVAQLLAPRLLAFSLRIALIVLPIALVTGTFGILASGALWAVTLLKGSDKILRYAIDKPAIESLYFPVPARIMVKVKLFIDTVGWRLGDGLAGLFVLIFATILGLSARQISWVTLIMLGLWLLAVYLVQRQYVVTLTERLKQHRLDDEHAGSHPLDRATKEMIAQQLHAEDSEEILYALNLLDQEQSPLIHPVMRDLLDHASAEVREKALSILNRAGDETVISKVDQMLKDEDLGVRTEALLYLTHHSHVDPLVRIQELGDFPNFYVRSAIIAFLVRSGRPENQETAIEILDRMVQEGGPEGVRTRLEAARLIRSLPGRFEDQLETLLNDGNTEVVRQAIMAVCANTAPHIILTVIEKLGDPDLTIPIAKALGGCGDAIVDLLKKNLLDKAVSNAIKREIPHVLHLIGTTNAKQVLMESLFTGDIELRSQIITSLTRLQEIRVDFDFDVQIIETLLAAEIMGHYRSYQIRDSLDQTLINDNKIVTALNESMKKDLERIFQLIKLLYPHHDLHSAHYGIQSENLKARDNALEFLEHVLKPELRSLLIPVLDPDVPFSKRVALADRLIGHKIETPVEALLTLIDHPEPWLKSSAAYTIGILGLTSLESKLDECLKHPDPLLRETAKQAKQRLAVSK